MCTRAVRNRSQNKIHGKKTGTSKRSFLYYFLTQHEWWKHRQNGKKPSRHGLGNVVMWNQCCHVERYPVDNFGTVVGENPDCLLLSGTVVGENPDHVCWVYKLKCRHPYLLFSQGYSLHRFTYPKGVHSYRYFLQPMRTPNLLMYIFILPNLLLSAHACMHLYCN